MPGTRRKNFKSFRDVAKQGATHFEVGHRSQKDPMLADSEASEHVLVPKESSAREKRWEEQMKYGIYYDDDYDYLQHLRDGKEIQDSEMLPLPDFRMKEDEGDEDTVSVSMASTTASRLTLPSSALGSAVERDVGLLDMQAASKEDWDPEIMAALEDGFNFDDPDNALDDDFIQRANTEAGPLHEEEEGDLADVSSAEDKDDEAEEDEERAEQCDEKVKGVSEWIQKMELERATDDDDDEGSDFGSGGMDSDDNVSECSGDMRGHKPTVSKYSAAMKPRNENLQLIDQLHEALLKREYSEDQMGALDGEKLGGRGTFDSDRWKQMEESFYKSQKTVLMKDMFNSEEKVRSVLPKNYYYVEEKDYSVEEEIDYSQEPLVTARKPQYDCETIRSTFSKKKYLPTPITFPEHMLTEKKEEGEKRVEETSSDGASVSTQQPGLSLKDLNRQSRLERLADAPSTFRPKDETPQERKDRKKEIKAMQRERRVEKSQNKTAFKEEMQRQKREKEDQVSQKRIISY